MKNKITSIVNRIKSKQAQRITAVVLALSVMLSAGMVFDVSAFAPAADPVYACGLEEHVHTVDCRNLICTETDPAHIHTETCYENITVCGLDGVDGHIHTPDCYEFVYICGLTEHTHGPECIAQTEPAEDADSETDENTENGGAINTEPAPDPLDGTLSELPELLTLPELPTLSETYCGMIEHIHEEGVCYVINCQENHVHNEHCRTYFCNLPEHLHTEECYVPTLADEELFGDGLDGTVEGVITPDLSQGDFVADSEPLPELPELPVLGSDSVNTQRVLQCTIPEHTHVLGVCYAYDCDEAHVHNDSCNKYWYCDIQEHVHTDACYVTVDLPVETTLTCGKEEHIHTDDCYVWECMTTGIHDHAKWGCQRLYLSCNKEEHTHGESCYMTSWADPVEQEIVCGMIEHTHVEGECYTIVCGLDHEHTEACRVYTCVLPEHVHTESCFVTVNGESSALPAPTCGIPEHTHTDECYGWVCMELGPHEHSPEFCTWTLTCGLQEHTHTAECYVVDIEPELPGMMYGCGLEEHTHGAECYDEFGNLTCTLPEHTHSDLCLPMGDEAAKEENQLNENILYITDRQGHYASTEAYKNLDTPYTIKQGETIYIAYKTGEGDQQAGHITLDNNNYDVTGTNEVPYDETNTHVLNSGTHTTNEQDGYGAYYRDFTGGAAINQTAKVIVQGNNQAYFYIKVIQGYPLPPVDDFVDNVFYVDVTIGNSEYGYQHKDRATAMLSDKVINLQNKVDINDRNKASKVFADFNNAEPNSENNPFIMYVGQVVNFKINAPQADSISYCYLADDGGYKEQLEFVEQAENKVDGNLRTCKLLGLKKGKFKLCLDTGRTENKYVDICVEVRDSMNVVTALGPKNIDYINEYVNTGNDWFALQKPECIVYGSDGLPIFIKNIDSGSFGFYRLRDTMDTIEMEIYTAADNDESPVIEETSIADFKLLSNHDDGSDLVETPGFSSKFRKIKIRLEPKNLYIPLTYTKNSKGEEVPDEPKPSRTKLTLGTETFYFGVYDMDNDNPNSFANHYDIEIADGGTYTVTKTSVLDGVTTVTTTVYRAYVSGINGCSIYDVENDETGLIEPVLELQPSEYLRRGDITNSSQYELTSAYDINPDGSVGWVATREKIAINQVKRVVFDLQLYLVPVKEKIEQPTGSGLKFLTPSDASGDKDTDNFYDVTGRAPEQRGSVPITMTGQEITDAYNKCPVHNGLDFTIKQNIFATESDFKARKEYVGGNLSDVKDKFSFELYNSYPDENDTSIADGVVGNDGYVNFTVKQNTQEDNTITPGPLQAFDFIETGKYCYYLKEKIPVVADGITYDTRIFRIGYKVEEDSATKMLWVTEITYDEVKNNGGKLEFNKLKTRKFTNGKPEIGSEEEYVPTFVNHAPFALPSTGGSGVMEIYTSGLILTGLATVIILLRKERKRRQPANLTQTLEKAEKIK